MVAENIFTSFAVNMMNNKSSVTAARPQISILPRPCIIIVIVPDKNVCDEYARGGAPSGDAITADCPNQTKCEVCSKSIVSKEVQKTALVTRNQFFMWLDALNAID